MSAEPDLASLLGSRLCHDLIGPIGAIGNGVELLLLSRGGASD
jgi:histidine phosphotransferase ChpT